MNQTLLFGGILLGLLGFGLVAVFSILALREKLAQRQASPAAEATPEAPSTPRIADQPAEEHWTEVMRLYRDRLTGQLALEIAGRRYTEADEIQDPAVRRGLLTIQTELAGWFTPADRSPEPAPVAPSAAPRPGPDPHPLPASPIQVLAKSKNPFAQFKAMREWARQPKPAQPKSIVEQIDEILQRRAAGSTVAAEGIKMETLPSGELQIVVGSERYTEIEAVPNPEIRTLIREAVKEWEAGR